MNFLDNYGITGTGTNTPPPSESQPEQSLNEEVSQVFGQLGRFWGGFRKQSEVALASARRDFGQVVTQAQRELEKLTTAETAPPGSSTTEGESSPGSDHEDESDAGQHTDTPTPETKHAAEPAGETDASASTSSSSSTVSFLARLQSSLPPTVVSAVQAQLPESLKNAQNIDLSQLRSTLSSEFQRVQGVTRAQAEEYVHKSEAMLREAMKEAGEALREAVKVIPPEEADSAGAPGVVWDGSDIWMLPGITVDANGPKNSSSSSKGKAKETDLGPSSRRQSEDYRRAVSTRAESLLKQLRSNPEIIKVDPAVDTSQDTYLAWADASEASGEGLGTKAWSERVAEALSDPLDGTVLQDTLDTLVPSCISEEVFWIRYFFRVHQIEAEESRRKVLLQVTADNDEDFSWEDDEDESASTKGAAASAKSLASSQRTLGPPRTTEIQSLPSSHAQSPAMSPRESSEDSYDVVSGNVSNAGDAQGPVEQTQEVEDSEESDWE